MQTSKTQSTLAWIFAIVILVGISIALLAPDPDLRQAAINAVFPKSVRIKLIGLSVAIPLLIVWFRYKQTSKSTSPK